MQLRRHPDGGRHFDKRRTVIDLVILPDGVRSALALQVRAKPDVETGGILIGRLHGPRTLYVTAASPPGPRARHGRFQFSRDTSYAQAWLDNRVRHSGGDQDYVGEWHVHPKLDAPPSLIDRGSLWKIAVSSRYHTRTPLLLIVEHEPPREMVYRGYCFAADPRRCVETQVVRRAKDGFR